jgi:GAF domain-containing protein/HAMP domain-containing protein
MPLATPEPVRQPPRRIARTIFWNMVLLALAPLLITWGIMYAFAGSQLAHLSFFGLQLGVVLLIGFTLASILLGWILARRVSRPLRQLSETMTVFQEGNREERAAIFREDEVGRIAEVFNQLADDLRETYHLLNIQGPVAREDRQQLLSSFAPLPSSASNVEELLKATLDQLLKQLNCTCAAIYLAERKEPVGPTFVMLSQVSIAADPASAKVARRLKDTVINLDSIPTLEWSVGNAIQSKRPQVAAVPGEPYLFEAAIPIIINTPGNGERVLGAFDLYTLSRSKDERLSPFSLQTVNELQMLARVFGLALLGFSRIEGTGKTQTIGLPGVKTAGAEQTAGVTGDPNAPTIPTGKSAHGTTSEMEVQRKSEAALIKAIRQIVRAETVDEIFLAVTQTLEQSPYASAILIHSQIMSSNEPIAEDSLRVVYKRTGPPGATELRVPIKMIREYFASGSPILIGDLDVHPPAAEVSKALAETTPDTASGRTPLPALEAGEGAKVPETSSLVPEILLQIPRQMGCEAAAFAPIVRGGSMIAMLILGRFSPTKARLVSPASSSRQRLTLGSSTMGTIPNPGYNVAAALTPGHLDPFISLIELMASGLQRINAQSSTQRKLAELESLWRVSQAASVETDLNAVYSVLHRQIEIVMGSIDSFAIALYDSKTDMIRIPYMVEEERFIEIPPFALGTGLSSIVIRTRKPLLLVEDVVRRSEELGAVVVGEPAKSWLGVPLTYMNEVMGLIIVQDTQQEHRFGEEDQRLLSTLATQIAVVLRNASLLETSRRLAYQERLINEISARIRRSVDIQTILRTTAEELGTALGAQRTHIQIDVGTGEE